MSAPPRSHDDRILEADLLDIVLTTAYLDPRGVLSRLLGCAVRVTGAFRARLTLVPWADAGEEVVTAARAGTPEPPPAGCSARAAVQVRGVVVGTVEVFRERPFTWEDHASLAMLAGTLAHVVDRARTTEVGERRRRWLEASAALSEGVSPPVDTAAALHRICEVARTVSGAVTTTALQWTPEGPAVLAATGIDARSRDWVSSVLDEVVDRLRPGAPGEADRARQLAAPDHRALCLPIGSRVASPAVLVVVYAGTSAAPGPDDVAVLEMLAEQGALLLDRLQAVTDVTDRRGAVERDRHAREVHDQVLQRLYATGLQLQGVRGAVDDPSTRDRIDLTIEQVDETMRQIRRALFSPGLVGAPPQP